MAVQKIVCSNGVRIVFEHFPYMRSVSTGVWVNVGSRYELPEENGLTHFIEHMFFKGTETRSAKQIAQAFDKIGAQANAFTGKDQTCYFVTSLDHHALESMQILADMFFHSRFLQEDIDKERQVILEEIAMSEDAADEDVDERLWQAMYPNNPIGAPILGTAETLATFTPEKIRTFIDEHYTPEEVIISIAGNIPEGFIDEVAALFDQFNGRQKRKDIVFETPVFHATHTEKASDIEQAHLAIGFPGLSVMDKRIVDLMIANNILGDSMSARLFQKVREERALAYTIYSYYSSYSDAGAFMIYGGTTMKQLKQMEDTILEVVDTFVKEGVTAEEVEAAKQQLESSLLLGLETSYDYMSRNARNETVYGENRTVEQALQTLENVTVDSVNRLIGELMTAPYARSVITEKEQA